MEKNNTIERMYLFESGKSLAYYEVADFIAECSQLFSLPLSDLGITGFDPDRL